MSISAIHQHIEVLS